jgi:hypothetical protein
MTKKCTYSRAPYPLILLMFLYCGIKVQAQDLPKTTPPSGQNHSMKGSHRLTLGLGHTHLSQGQIEGRTDWLPIASWTLNYDYWLSDKWAIGLQNDWILETFVVVHSGDKELERKNPWAVVPVAVYKFANRWTGIAGVGAEFSEGHAITMTRLGI